MKWILLILVLLFLVGLGIALVVTRIEISQFNKNSELVSFQPQSTQTIRKTAVVVFSRSGNTGVLAEHIAQIEDADIFEIFSDDYKLGIPGWITALKDARSPVATITPQTIDLSQYDKIYLGSPIWLYSPAPPIWQFAKNSRFDNKDVVLFNTFNSKFEQHFIDSFEDLVRQQGAIHFTHRYVKRGRMGEQLSTKQMLAEFDAQFQ